MSSSEIPNAPGIPQRFRQGVSEYLLLQASLAKWNELVKSVTDRKKELSKDLKTMMVEGQVAQVGPFERGYIAELQTTPKVPELTEAFVQNIVAEFNKRTGTRVDAFKFAQFFLSKIKLETEFDVKFTVRQPLEQKKKFEVELAQQTIHAISNNQAVPHFDPLAALAAVIGVNPEVLTNLNSAAVKYSSEKKARQIAEKRGRLGMNGTETEEKSAR